ncbi:hypothetical protein AB834_01125 [PVC group bacterium (ex Bugula neritina AB1)]|nr:hypothetical protein AB834_01125 [PVC group bacterium (ex Bugula neritina AB1)]
MRKGVPTPTLSDFYQSRKEGKEGKEDTEQPKITFQPRATEVFSTMQYDVTVLAALENVLTKKNVKGFIETQVLNAEIVKDLTPANVKHTVICLANGPINQFAMEELKTHGILVVEDIYASAGGVYSSLLEAEENRTGVTLTVEEGYERIREKMKSITLTFLKSTFNKKDADTKKIKSLRAELTKSRLDYFKKIGNRKVSVSS